MNRRFTCCLVNIRYKRITVFQLFRSIYLITVGSRYPPGSIYPLRQAVNSSYLCGDLSIEYFQIGCTLIGIAFQFVLYGFVCSFNGCIETS